MVSFNTIIFALAMISTAFIHSSPAAGQQRQGPTLWQKFSRPITSEIAKNKQRNTLNTGDRWIYDADISKHQYKLLKSPFQPAKDAIRNGWIATGQSISNFGAGVKTTINSGVTASFSAARETFNWKKNEYEYKSLGKKLERKKAITVPEKRLIEKMHYKLYGKNEELLTKKGIMAEMGRSRSSQRRTNRKLKEVVNKWGERTFTPEI